MCLLGGVADLSSLHGFHDRDGPTSTRAHEHTLITRGAYRPHGFTGGE